MTEGDCSSNLWVWPTTFNEFTITFEPAPDLKPLPAYDQVRESVIALPKKEQAQLYRWMYDALGCRR